MIQEVEKNVAREQVTKRVLSARTLPEIFSAQQLLRDWIRTHPEEEGMRDGFEQLSLMQDIAEQEAAERDQAETLTAGWAA